jgi:hypothetical protein
LFSDSNPSTGLEFTVEVERLYAGLMAFAAETAAPGLGGKLLYAGELDDVGRGLLVAASICGAASLAATASSEHGKQAMRDGIADFLVNSLDEALRILKNEVRKRETAAVCVTAPPEALAHEMRERGVAPDLTRATVDTPAAAAGALLAWRVESAPAQWLPKLDAIASECLDANPGPGIDAARRWLRQSPRYLGRLAQGWRVLRCSPDAGIEFAGRVRAAALPVDVEIDVNLGGQVIRIAATQRESA